MTQHSVTQHSVTQHSPRAHRAIRRLAGVFALGALGAACTPTPPIEPPGSSGHPVTTPSAGSANVVAGGRTRIPTPAPPSPVRPAPASPAAQGGSPNPKGPIPVTEADLSSADTGLAELDTQLSEAARDLATQEGDL